MPPKKKRQVGGNGGTRIVGLKEFQQDSICGYFSACVLKKLRSFREESNFTEILLKECMTNGHAAWVASGTGNNGIDIYRVAETYNPWINLDLDYMIEIVQEQNSNGEEQRLSEYLLTNSGNSFAFIIVGVSFVRTLYINNDANVYLFDSHAPSANITKFTTIGDFLEAERILLTLTHMPPYKPTHVTTQSNMRG